MADTGDRKVALITEVTGQDGAYLAELLLAKGYLVHGIKRRSSYINTGRIDHLYQDPHEADQQIFLHYGDMTDGTNLLRLVKQIQPDEIYNLAAQSHVQVGFETAEYTANADALGLLRLLEAIRQLGLAGKTRFCQASELYGKARETPQNELTPFYPHSPYAAAELYAYWRVVNYREAYHVHASNGILFNHESPLRGETFVSRKITRAAAAIRLGLQDRLFLGDLDAARDWGHAREYVRDMWLVLQQDEPDDYVQATGETHSVGRAGRARLRAGGHADPLARRRRRGEGRRCCNWRRSGRGRSPLLPPDRDRRAGSAARPRRGPGVAARDWIRGAGRGDGRGRPGRARAGAAAQWRLR